MIKRSVFSSPNSLLSFRGITITFELSVWYAFAVVMIISVTFQFASIFDKIHIEKVPLGVFRLRRLNLEQGKPKTGDHIALSWKKEDGSIWGGTEGCVVGVTEDSHSKPYLILDRSTYGKSLKSLFFSLGLLDLWMVPTSDIESIIDLSQRERPSGLSEKMHLKIEIDYRTNMDYQETIKKLKVRGDCHFDVNQPAQTENACNFIVRDITSIREATIVFSPKGNIQIHCQPKQLNDCVNWLEESVVIQEGHTHLVLVPTNFMLNIHDVFKESADPTIELIERLAKIEGETERILFPLGWVDYFFDDMEYNYLENLFSDSHPKKDRILIRGNRNKANNQFASNPVDTNMRVWMNMDFLDKTASVAKYISSEFPTMQLSGLILKPEEENGLKNMWFRSRPYPFSGLDLGGADGFHGKVLIRNLLINRKKGAYTVNFRKYYGTDFSSH